MTTGDVVYSLRFSLIRSAKPGPGFDLGSTAVESSTLSMTHKGTLLCEPDAILYALMLNKSVMGQNPPGPEFFGDSWIVGCKFSENTGNLQQQKKEDFSFLQM